MALILCIGFLALLSVLGAFVMDMTTRDIKLSGKAKVSGSIFRVADQAVEYALSPSVYGSLTGVGDTVDLTVSTHKDVFVTPGGPTDLFVGSVTYEGYGGTPANSDQFDTTASAGKVYRYFHVYAEAGSTNTAITERHFIDAQLAQAFPTVTNVPVTYASGKQGVSAAGGN
ncbi:MAG: hypothetical protein C0614_01135 [Desulfuromonas sp.]|nr:MAG: hypothetical protein C0614_01135 [Desulfuromonas sp.]